jgi:hypothetical protein
VLVLTVEHEHVTEVFTGFGERGRSAESVAEQAASEAREYLAHDAPVGPHLADQLLLPMVFGGLTAFRTCAPTPHFTSNADVIHAFTGKRIVAERDGEAYAVRISWLRYARREHSSEKHWKTRESELRVEKVMLGLSRRRNIPFLLSDEIEMLSIYGKALFETLRDTHRGVLGCPSIDLGRWSLPLARDYRVHGSQPTR